MEMFFLLPFWLRAALILFLVIVLLWLALGKIILKILSVIPFLLRKVCWYIYLILETPVAMLHKKFGSVFGKMDNALSHAGERVDTVMQAWYKAWHFPDKIHFGRLLLIYGVCVIFVVFPSFVNIDNKFLSFGERTYTHYETRFASWMEKKGWYDPEAKVAWNQEEQAEEEDLELEDEITEDDFEEITLVVSGVESSLLIRDIPSVDDCAVLDRLVNEDTVIWRGQMIFAKADNDHVEPWVKVITSNDAEGWCRLFYLHPDEYEGKEFRVSDIED